MQADLSQPSPRRSRTSPRQRKAKEAARIQLAASIGSQNTLIAATTERVGMHQQLEAKGWDSRARVLEAMEPLKEQQTALVVLQGSLADAGGGDSRG